MNTRNTTGIRNTRLRHRRNILYMPNVDNFSLKNVFKKIDQGASKVVGAIAPKFQAKLDAAKEKAKEDDGKVSFGEKIGIGFKNATVPMIGVAAGLAGLGIVANQVGKKEHEKLAAGVSATEDIPVPLPETTLVADIKKAASKITPANIDKATKLVNAGKGLLTKEQKVIAGNLTSPSMLPKTKASKDAERALTLPYVSKSDIGVVEGSIPFDSNTYIIAGIVLTVIVILAIVLKK